MDTDLIILDENFQMIYILDKYESLIWVDKYSEPGTFEICAYVNSDLLKFIKPDYYIQSRFSNHTMIIEDVSIESDAENGNKMKIVGRSLESILDRRIVWRQTNLDGNLQTGIGKLLYANVIGGDGTTSKPSIVGGDGRKITNFLFVPSGDTAITSLTMEHQYTGDSLLDVITSLCDESKIGYKITLSDNNEYVFELYSGTNRSYNQNEVPYVVFSPSFDNIISSNYVNRNSVTKNAGLVAGEGEGTSRKTVSIGTATGVSRREVYIDARSIRQENLSTSKYNAKLTSYGTDKLTEINKEKESFDGKCETTRLYVYGRDFFLGDIIQMTNEYGIEKPSRITEFTWSISTGGIETYPTFVSVDD